MDNTATIASPNLQHGHHDDSNLGRHFDVIVIGSGVAGLSAAKHLQQAFRDQHCDDKTLLVLEARNRIGGRTYTYVDDNQDSDHENTENAAPSQGKPQIHIDLGATWIHGTKKSGQPIALMADAMNYKLILDSDMGETIHNCDTGKIYSTDEVNKAEHVFGKTLKRAKSHARSLERYHDQEVSLQEALEMVDPGFFQNPLLQYILRQRIEFDYGGPADTVSGAYFDTDEEFAGGDYIPQRGYGPIINRLAQGLSIQMDTPVQTIEYDVAGVRLHTNRGIYSASKVVCTIPLGVLKSGSVQFRPGLSQSKQDAIVRLGWGTISKVGLLFNNVFWPSRMVGFGVAGEDPLCQYILNKYAFNEVPMLEVYMVGKRAQEMDQRPNDQVIDEILSEISSLFGEPKETLEQSLVKTYIQKWGAEAFTRGAYGYAAPSTEDEDFEAFEYSQLKVLFFAGEHTCADYRGTVQGAFLSGRRAAEDILEVMKKKSKLRSPASLIRA